MPESDFVKYRHLHSFIICYSFICAFGLISSLIILNALFLALIDSGTNGYIGYIWFMPSPTISSAFKPSVLRF